MQRHPLTFLLAACTILAGQASAETTTGWSLGDAFQATFGQAAPVTRHVDRPIYDGDRHKVIDHLSLEMELWPDRLMSVDGNRFALIIKEFAKDPAHITQGAIAVSYLHRSNSGWTLDHVWPELFYDGASGEPANAGAKVRRFGSASLFLAAGEWCGSGACSDNIDVLSLAASGPVYLGGVRGGAQFKGDDIYPGFKEPSCPDYAYTAVVGPPMRGRGIFSVTYEGWTADPDSRAGNTHFHLRADAVPDGNGLALRPKVVVPACGG